jgi:CelD/BcsL family acetyltransferase involved in cellulose biosynthesis
LSHRVEVRRARDFDDPALRPEAWDALLRRGESDEVFLTRGWQQAWWRTFGRGELLLLIAERDGVPVAIASLFADSGMVYFVGAGSSDYLDFIGDAEHPPVLDALLTAARDIAPGFLGFVFHHIPDTSRTGDRLAAAADRLGLIAFHEGRLPAPAMSLRPDTVAADTAIRKKSLMRHENGFRRSGRLEVNVQVHPQDVSETLEVVFAQHIERWSGTDFPSLFLDPAQRLFYQRLCEIGEAEGWLRLARIDWNGEAIAAHVGFHHRGRYLWYKPTFAIAHAKRSPGEVLLRQLILAAVAEGAETFDFGLGDEAFKARFATHVRHVDTWGLYAPAAVDKVGS